MNEESSEIIKKYVETALKSVRDYNEAYRPTSDKVNIIVNAAIISDLSNVLDNFSQQNSYTNSQTKKVIASLGKNAAEFVANLNEDFNQAMQLENPDLEESYTKVCDENSLQVIVNRINDNGKINKNDIELLRPYSESLEDDLQKIDGVVRSKAKKLYRGVKRIAEKAEKPDIVVERKAEKAEEPDLSVEQKAEKAEELDLSVERKVKKLDHRVKGKAEKSELGAEGAAEKPKRRVKRKAKKSELGAEEVAEKPKRRVKRKAKKSELGAEGAAEKPKRRVKRKTKELASEVSQLVPENLVERNKARKVPNLPPPSAAVLKGKQSPQR